MTKCIGLTVGQYIDHLQRQTDKEKRHRMKLIAFAVVYSPAKPGHERLIYMPLHLLPNLEDQS